MKAYLVNDYYVFTSYNELSSHIHDIVHHTRPEKTGSHLIYIINGEFNREEGVFISENGEKIPINSEDVEGLYYSEKVGVG